MRKTNKDRGSDISLKVILKEIIVGTIVGVLVSLISANFFTTEKINSMVWIFFFVGLILFLFITLVRRLLKEMEAKKDLERQKERTKKTAKGWENLYYQEKESKEKYYKMFEEKFKKVEERNNKLGEKVTKLEREKQNLRNQLFAKEVPWEEHDIDDENQQLEAIVEVKVWWGAYQDKNEKINEQTMEEMLGNWENRLKNKKGKELAKERKRLLKKIKEEAELAKN